MMLDAHSCIIFVKSLVHCTYLCFEARPGQAKQLKPLIMKLNNHIGRIGNISQFNAYLTCAHVTVIKLLLYSKKGLIVVIISSIDMFYKARVLMTILPSLFRTAESTSSSEMSSSQSTSQRGVDPSR